MAASNTDRFKKAKRKFETTVGVGGILAGGTTLPLTSVTGLDTTTAVTLVVGAGTATEEVITGVVSGSSLINCVRGKEGTTDSAHSAGESVNMYFTETHWDDLIDGILVEHNQDGTHSEEIITSRTEDTTPATDDLILTSDTSASAALKKVQIGNITPRKADKSLLTTDSNPYKFSAYRSAGANINNATEIVFDAESFDTNSNFSTSTGRYTAPIDGFYMFSTTVGWNINSNANVAFGISMRIGGSTVIAADYQVNMYTGVFAPFNSCSTLVQLTASQYVSCFSINANPTSIGTGVGTNFTGFLVSRT